jgi:hypothetical protein
VCEIVIGRGAAPVVPDVEQDPAVRPIRAPHDVPRGGHIGNRRHRREFERDLQPALARAVAQPREGRTRVVDGRGRSEVRRHERGRAQPFAQVEEPLLVVGGVEHAVLGERRRAEPVADRLNILDADAVGVEQREQVVVRQPIARHRPPVCAREDGDKPEARRRGRRDDLLERERGDGEVAEHELVAESMFAQRLPPRCRAQLAIESCH